MELINGRTAEEIKTAIRECESTNHCNGCPYADVFECGDAIQRDALALIERLEAAQPRWISVEERLPEVDAQYDGYEYSAELLVFDGTMRRGAYYCHTTKLWHDNRYEDNTLEVTHWMPLPEPPKEGA